MMLVMYGMAPSAEGASIVNDGKSNATDVPWRSGRTYDGPQQFVSIPVGFYKPADESSASIETEDDSKPKYNVPTSFDDFVPSDKISRNSYPAYNKGIKDSYKGAPPKWKGDSGMSPSWVFPSPADMAMMMTVMKAMNEDQSPDVPDGLAGFFSKLTSDPAALIGVLMIPTAILLAALVPTLASLFSGDGNSGSTPLVTTVATGSTGRKLSDNPSFVKPILEAIENFSARSASEHTCLQKSFCDATRGSNSTDFRPIQKNIYKAFTFVDDYWLEALGVKQLMEAMGSGDCDKIECETTKVKDRDFNKKHA